MEENVNTEVVPIFLSFSNVCTSVDKLKILQDVSGKVRPGELMAIMGPSGSGKTTLLNVLAGRLAVDSGEVLINGKKLNKKLKRKICYVLQEDIFFSHLTLRETLTFSAMLRLPDTMSKKEKIEKVKDIVDTLDLVKCLDTVMGNQTQRGLSGGEKKRANIGCELITNPSLVFLDEPTSGLDSSNACNLVTTLKNIAIARRKTIVASIHQPSSQIFFMFDKLLLLCNGQTAFYGTPSGVIQFFEEIGMPCEEHYNPADFILEKVNSNKALQDEIVKKWSERPRNKKKSSALIPESLNVEKEASTFNQTKCRKPFSKEYGLKNVAFEMESVPAQNTDKKAEEKSAETVRKSPLLNEKVTEDTPQDAGRIPTSNSSAHNGIRCENIGEHEVKIHLTNFVSKTQFDEKPHNLENEVLPSIKHQSMTEDIHQPDDELSDCDDEEFEHIPTTWVTSFWTQFTVLCERNFKETKPAILSPLNIIQTLGLAVIVSLVWFRTPYKESSINDRYAMLFFIATFWSTAPLFEALLIFPSEGVVINKERSSGYYRLSAYYLAKTVSELPLVLFQPTLFIAIIYWPTGLNLSVSFLTTLLAVLTSTMTAQAMGFCLGATVMNFKKTLVIAALFVMANMLLGGFYQQNVPSWLIWAKYLSFIKYSFSATVISEFKTSPPFHCNRLISSYVNCQQNGTVIHGTDILRHFNVEKSFWENISILIAVMAAFRVLTYLILRYIRKPR